MELSSTVLIALNAFAAMAKIALMSLVGITLAKYPKDGPIMNVSFLQSLSRLSNNVFVPCLILTSLGSGVNAALLSRIGVLIIFCVIVNLISFTFGHTLGWILHQRRNDDMFIALTVAIGSPNAISLPIMVLQTMCENDIVNKDYQSNATMCYSEGSSMLFVYSIGWHLMFWSYGFPMLKALKEKHMDALMREQSGHPSSTAILPVADHLCETGRMSRVWSTLASSRPKFAQFVKWGRSVLFTPAMMAIIGGIVISLVPSLQSMLFQDVTVLRPLGSAITTLGDPVVATSCLIMSASLANVDLSRVHGSGVTVDVGDNVPVDKTTTSGSNSSSNPGTVKSKTAVNYALLRSDGDESAADEVANSGIIHSNKHATNNPIHKAGIEGSTIGSSTAMPPIGGVGDVHEHDHDNTQGHICPTVSIPIHSIHSIHSAVGGEHPSPLPSWGSIAALVICRLILPPLVVIYAVLPAALRLQIIRKEDRLMQLVIAVESASSSAQVMIVSLNQLGLTEIAANMSYMYVFQYVSSIFSITLWVTIAMSAIYK